MFLITNANLYDRLFREHPDTYYQILNLRFSRMQSTLAIFMGTEFTSIPKPTMQSLSDRITRYQTFFEDTGTTRWLDKKQEAQNLIDTQQFAQENTPDYDYHVNYFNKLNSFVWPDANELVIRQQEEIELLALLN